MRFVIYGTFSGFSCDETTCSQFGEQTIGSSLCTNTCVVMLVPFSKTHKYPCFMYIIKMISYLLLLPTMVSIMFMLICSYDMI